MLFNTLYNTIKTKLNPITDIKNIEWYLEQDKRKGGIVQTPTVLIKFKTANPKQISKMHQEVEVDVEIKLFTDYNKTNHKITDNNIHFMLEEAIFNHLKNDDQIEIVPAQRNNGLLYSSQTYRIKTVISLPTKQSPNLIHKTDLTPNINTTLDLSS